MVFARGSFQLFGKSSVRHHLCVVGFPLLCSGVFRWLAVDASTFQDWGVTHDPTYLNRYSSTGNRGFILSIVAVGRKQDIMADNLARLSKAKQMGDTLYGT